MTTNHKHCPKNSLSKRDNNMPISLFLLKVNLSHTFVQWLYMKKWTLCVHGRRSRSSGSCAPCVRHSGADLRVGLWRQRCCKCWHVRLKFSTRGRKTRQNILLLLHQQDECVRVCAALRQHLSLCVRLFLCGFLLCKCKVHPHAYTLRLCVCVCVWYVFDKAASAAVTHTHSFADSAEQESSFPLEMFVVFCTTFSLGSHSSSVYYILFSLFCASIQARKLHFLPSFTRKCKFSYFKFGWSHVYTESRCLYQHIFVSVFRWWKVARMSLSLTTVVWQQQENTLYLKKRQTSHGNY